jgi:hypothetical protein
MGYDLSHHKRANWFDEPPDIDVAAWYPTSLAIQTCGELPVQNTLCLTAARFRYNSPSMAEWTGHSSREVVWFDFRDARIVVKNPDEETITRDATLAAQLGARVARRRWGVLRSVTLQVA